jgi:TonB family protein
VILSTLFNGLWQGIPIVAIALILSRAIPQHNATTRHALWFATLIALVVVPIAAAASNAGASLLATFHPHRGASSYVVTLIPYGPVVEHADAWFARWATWIVGAWLVGVSIGLARLAVSFVRIEGIRRRATPLAAEPGVLISEEIAVPIVAGIFAPSIVIPKPMLTELTQMDLQRIVQHERAHVRRRDTLSNLFQRLIEACLFFNPWVRIAGSYLTNEREAACDDWVVEKTGDSDEYAACLATLAQTINPKKAPLLTPSAFRSRHALVARIERLASTAPRGLTVNSYVIGGTVMLFVILTLALQAFAPASALMPAADADSGGAAPRSIVAAGCTHPNADALVTNAVAPDLPHGLKASGSVIVAVTLAPNAHVVRTSIVHSSGNATIDNAVVKAARASTYSPKTLNCTPVQGSYLFRADFTPN